MVLAGGAGRATGYVGLTTMATRWDALLPVFALAAALIGHTVAARADLITGCASEVSQFCTDVTQGRGRLSACLAGHMNQLGSGCLPEVQAVARSPLVPGGVRKNFNPAFRAALPQACVTPAAQFCPGVPAGDGRVFACLYAR